MSQAGTTQQSSRVPKYPFDAPNKAVAGDDASQKGKRPQGVSPKKDGAAPKFQANTVLEGVTTAGKKHVTISSGDRFIQLEDGDHGGWTRLNAVVLRDSCTCASCTDGASGQKSYATTDIPGDIGIGQIRATQDGLGIKFTNDIPRLASPDHEMTLSWDVVDEALGHQPPSSARRHKPVHPIEDTIYPKTGRTFWDATTIQSRVRKMDYAEFMEGGQVFWQTLLDLGNLGLVFLKNVPRDEESIVRITTRIANIKETFYGRTFDVRAKIDAENVAYTSGYLGLHQDLLYLERPPAIQLLHCLENSCSGGESLFSDGLRAGKLMWMQDAVRNPALENLASLRVPYHYEKHGYFYQRKRPLFNTTSSNGSDGGSGSVLGNVFWSPPFQDRFPVPAADMRGWLAPAQLFERLINEPSAMYQVKMAPGECVLFDNLRVMHGRTAFDASGGSRWLRGAYIEREDFVSRVLHIPEDLAKPYRGGEWDRETEDLGLRESPWFDDVKSKLEAVSDDLQQKGVEMSVADRQLLNGEIVY